MNMTSRNVALAALAAVLAVPTWLQLNADADTFVDLARVPRMFEGFTTDNVGAVLLAVPKADQPEQPAAGSGAGASGSAASQIAYDQLVLQRFDGGWRIGQLGDAPNDLAGAPVMTSRVDNDVFEHLRTIRSDPETLVQPNATDEQLALYGLDDAHAMLIRATDKGGRGIVAEILVGNDAGTGQVGTEAVRGVFVRQRQSRDVVLYEWQKPWRRDIDVTRWLDRTLLRLEPDRVRRLSIRNAASGSKTFVFARGLNRASFEAESGADDLGALRQTEIEGLVQRFRYLAVQAYERPLARAGDMSALGLFPAQVAIELEVASGENGSGEIRKIQLQIGRRVAGRNEFYASCSESEFLLTLSPAIVTQFELDTAQRLFDPKK